MAKKPSNRRQPGKDPTWRPLPAKSGVQEALPTLDRSGRFPIDTLLRHHGYQIWRRVRDQEPVWFKNGVEFTQSDILRRLDPNDLADAEYAEALLTGELGEI